ncbi:predicted protein [Sclerotinia sclerotiorum 1980 UF-70]|uniref:Uncharacterized protein n=1 Tax=Sclerotinia sclerotiorum (strain ATCC 18683 / 1980 / Ss-1) TaxID=665079 RepID=A7F7D6_SCLS1|nr:predicted protein [Sclerotinia sclerotiorum 1980 UF-70]EDN98657.1 predicted protein [Sclerotinia sclerotiorum 1980 UF-70]
MPGVPPKALETLKAKFKALFKGKKSKKAEEPTAGAETDAAAPPTANSAVDPNDDGTAPEVTATEHTHAEDQDPTTAEQTSAGAEPAHANETGEPPYIIGTLVKAHSTDTEMAAPEASKVEDPIKTEPSAPIVSATAPQL